MPRKVVSFLIVLAIGATLNGCKSKEEECGQRGPESRTRQVERKMENCVASDADEDEEGTVVLEPTIYYVIDDGMMKLVFKNKDGTEEVLEYQKLAIVPDKDVKQIDMTLSDEKGNPIKMASTKKGITGKKRRRKPRSRTSAFTKWMATN